MYQAYSEYLVDITDKDLCPSEGYILLGETRNKHNKYVNNGVCQKLIGTMGKAKSIAA